MSIDGRREANRWKRFNCCEKHIVKWHEHSNTHPVLLLKVIPLVSYINTNIQIKLTIMLAMQETTGFSSPKERLSGFPIVQVTWKPGSFSLAICWLHLQYFHGFTCSHIFLFDILFSRWTTRLQKKLGRTQGWCATFSTCIVHNKNTVFLLLVITDACKGFLMFKA